MLCRCGQEKYELNRMRLHKCFFLILGLLTPRVASYSSGLVYPSCDTMIPIHGSNEAQKTEAPYMVTTDGNFFHPGDNITVYLDGINGTIFKGFLLQARTFPGDEIIGHFIVIDPESQNLTCGGVADSSLSHINSNNKSHISALWVAPASADKVQFRATFTESRRIFWVGVESPLLTNVNRPTSPTSATSAPPVSSNVSTSSHTTLTIPPTSRVTSNFSPVISGDTCGKQKICFSMPSNCDPSKTTNCMFMSSTLMKDGTYYFEISGPSNGYVSFGFSDDQIMGHDDIYLCRMDSTGQLDIQHAYSEGRRRPIILPLTNVEVKVMSYTGGVIQCAFTSRNQISTQPPNQQLRSNSSMSNMMYFIMLAYGPATNGVIGFHGDNAFVSDTKVNLSTMSNVTHTGHHGTILVKTHGALMLIAWMTTGSLGMILARYFKVAGKKLVAGKPVWFESHMLWMLLTVAATITSFVLAFVEAKGWASHVSTHSILGCLVMILSFIQPFVSFMRPSPESSKRFIFNWFHGINALLIKVLAVANLFLGFQFIDHKLGWLVNVMAGFCGWEALLIILFEMNASWALKETKTKNEIEMKTKNEVEMTKVSVKYENYLLLIYLCGNLAFLITLLVGIGKF